MDNKSLVQINALGNELYGNEWSATCLHLCLRFSKKRTGKVNRLSDSEADSLIRSLERLKAQRIETYLSFARDQAAGDYP